MSFEFVCVMMPPRGLLSEGNVAFGECFHHVLEHFGGRRLPFVLLRVIQHPGADTELTLLHLKDGMADGHGMALGEGSAPVKAVREYAREQSLRIVVESETCQPTGMEEVGRCMRYLRGLEP